MMTSKLDQQVTKNNLTVSRPNKRSSSCGREVERFDPIPVDLVINILSRLSQKFIVRCRCVSKLWSSIIRRPNYNQLFPIKSMDLAPPQLLFVYKVAEELLFNSSPQPHNPNMNSSLVATLRRRTSSTNFSKFSGHVRGLVCRQHAEGNYTFAVITNPITGESLTLPKLRMVGCNSERNNGKVRYYFGYDPIDKQFKVLRITWLRCGERESCGEYQVLALGTGNLSWRKIQCCTLHYPLEGNGIWINGVLYYPAGFNNGKYTVVCFDVRSEKFSFINIDNYMALKMVYPVSSTLIDYKGKLGACSFDINNNVFELWVLEDAEEHKWLKHIYQMPHQWLNETRHDLRLAGMVSSGEIVLFPDYTRDIFFIYYYNLESNIITRVRLEVPVLGKFNYCRVYTFINFVEAVTLI
ncbi:putative F-box protein At1g53550 [Arabidopsis lyrata subsp. lyrata]|uniref:putative F-box protein At1g53550 n=1 Tax=Arabidopsis lyrata subsp. lyrata TaxID=81972 RepID=UPI000A29AB99|nr:putative F-box protein At1g53550 [Arabidopsis lyrata subsp. lyrata]|eukprot:XP_020867164.1 putative F-box protein At1g53550 [Arabidopsis lyrata subsp. lyrata]